MSNSFSITQQIKCVKREIAFRKKLYPRWVSSNNITQEKADYEIGCMESVLQNLEDIKITEDAHLQLFYETKNDLGF